MSQFSSSMALADLDYIAPSQACIKPMLLKQQAGGAGGVQRHLPGEAPPPEEIIKISLQDCLACSGCVTTAETMLVTSQSRGEIEAVAQANRNSSSEEQQRPLFVSISDQAAASIAVQLGVSLDAAMRVVSGFFREVVGARAVVDLRWALKASLIETAKEFVRRVRHEPQRLPLIVSACPGWVCYCEKTHPELLPLLCPVMSSQGIAGAYAKHTLGGGVYHVSIEPCFDKKLEAARDTLHAQSGGDSGRGDAYTDCVLSSAELLEWMRDTNVATPWAAPLDSVPDGIRGQQEPCEALGVEGSGGYHQFAMMYAAAKLAQAEVRYSDLRYEAKRNANHRVVTCAQLPNANFCIAYGFQHIQNLVRGLKRPTSTTPKYAFIEVMACPDGCLNGGGQVRTQRYAETLVNVKATFETYSQAVAAQNSSGDADDLVAKARRVEQPPEAAAGANWFSTDALERYFAVDAGSETACGALCTEFHDRKRDMEQQANIVHSLKW